MKILIIGAGRMGVRHAMGVLKSHSVQSLTLTDISIEALQHANTSLSNNNSNVNVFFETPDKLVGSFDVIIIASTAKDRLSIIKKALLFKPKYMLIEKPLEQSYKQVVELTQHLSGSNTTVNVNLNMRMYPFVKDLKENINQLPQFQGLKHINYSGGALGIGANGIHYLDLIFYLLDADEAKIISASIDEVLIKSGRGSDFGDFGGWAIINFYKETQLVGKSHIILLSDSTVFGGWEIIGQHGRVRINELEGERVDILRNPLSTLPAYRYAAEYLPPVSRKIESPFLGDLTNEWLNSILEKKQVLPTITESLKVHQLMFDWLAYSETHSNIFPIT